MTRNSSLGVSVLSLCIWLAVDAARPAAASVSVSQESGRVAIEPPSEVPELTTDRPDFTESAIVVPLGSVQLESGFTYSDFDRFSLFSAPETLVRWGFARHTELRVTVPNYNRITGRGGDVTGLGDISVGFKQQFGPVAGWDLAVIGAVFLPSGQVGFTTGSPDPVAELCWSRDLAERWSVGGVAALTWPTIDNRREFTPFVTVAVNHALGGPWNTFLEYFGVYPERSGSLQTVHHGYTYAITRTSQADIHFGFGFTADAPRYFVGAGYAQRFDYGLSKN